MTFIYADSFKTLLTTEFCEKDHPHRPLQERAYVFFYDFADECEGVFMCTVRTLCVSLTIYTGGDCECTLQDILVFLSGAEEAPPSRF